jgi:hexosaminidase
LFNPDDVLLQVPSGLIAMEWGYEGDHPFDATCARLAAASVPFYVCPGTSSWNSFVGRTRNMLENIRGACRAACAHGGLGMLVGFVLVVRLLANIHRFYS